MAKPYFVFSLFLIFLTVAACEEDGDPRITVTDAWAPETAKGVTSHHGDVAKLHQDKAAIYFNLKNTGAGHDKLIGASTYEAGSVVLANGAEEVVESIPVRKRDEVSLEPGGLHVMLLDLRGPLTKGQWLTLTLLFEKSPEWVVRVPIMPSGTVPSIQEIKDAARSAGKGR